MVRLRARLARLLRRRCTPAAPLLPHADAEHAARELRIAAAHVRGLGRRLAERARSERARSAILAALLATEHAAVLHEARAGAMRRSGGKPPLLH